MFKETFPRPLSWIFLWQTQRRLVCFSFIVCHRAKTKSATKCIVFIPFIAARKHSPPHHPPDMFFLILLCDDEGTSPCVAVSLPTCALMLASSPSGWCGQPPPHPHPPPCGSFPAMQWSGTVCDWPRSRGQIVVWLADAMHPGMLLKVFFSEADLVHAEKTSRSPQRLICSSFASFQVESDQPWFLWAPPRVTSY